MLESTAAERRLIEAAQAGEMLDVSREPERDVRAVVIRGLLCGWHTEGLDPRGVRLRGAHVVGELDLTDVRAPVPLVLTSGEHDAPIVLTRAHLPHLDLSGSAFPELVGDDLVCEHDARLGAVRCGEITLVDAHVAGDLSLRRARLVATDSPALDANGARIGSDLFLDEGFTAESDSADGTVSLLDTAVGGQLSLSGARLTATKGPALHADGARIGSDLFLDKGLTARSDSIRGVLRVSNAAVTGQLNMRGAHVVATSGPALHADGLTVSGSGLFLTGGFTACSDGERDTIRLLGAFVAGQLSLSGARVTAARGPALAADGLTVGADLSLIDGFVARSDSAMGALRLLGAAVTGQVNLNGARVMSTSGPALYADGLTVGGELFLTGGFAATAESGTGAAVRLIGASVAGGVDLSGAELTATGRPALWADTLTVDGDLVLAGGFVASSGSADGTLRLPGATINGDVVVSDARVRNTDAAGVVLDVGGVRIDGDLTMSVSCFRTDEGSRYRVHVDGLRYAAAPRGATLREWLTLVGEHTPGYAAQPYQQLAAVHRAAGHDQDARRVLIAQQRDLRRRGALGGRGRRLLHAMSGMFIGHGHRPFRALGFLAGVCALTGALVLAAGLSGLAVRPDAASPATACSPAESIGLALDTAVPLLKTGGGKQCEIAATTPRGQVLYLATYALRALGWAFATLFVAGYTGLVRRTP